MIAQSPTTVRRWEGVAEKLLFVALITCIYMFASRTLIKKENLSTPSGQGEMGGGGGGVLDFVWLFCLSIPREHIFKKLSHATGNV